MSESPAGTPPVGEQLARHREQLDLTQGALAQMIGISVTSVSSAENGRSTIRRGKRSDWEQALRLRPGTLSRAYERGSPLEALDPPTEASLTPDLADARERTIWDMNISESDRLTMINLLRADRQEGKRRA